jgi:polar amino acid transport system substrate-binding protein
MRRARSAVRIATAVGVVVLLVNVVSPLGHSTFAGQARLAGLLATIQRNRQIVIGTSNDPPWSYVTKSGEAEGIIPDILREFLRAEGISATIKSIPLPFASLIPSLVSGRIQLIGDAMYVTPARAKVVSFTRVIFYNPEALVVAKGNPYRLSALKDLCGHGKSGGTYEGTVWVNTLKQASASCPAGQAFEVKLYPTVYDAIADVSSGRLTAALIDSSIAAYALRQNPKLNIELAAGYQPPDKARDGCGLAVTKGNDEFLAEFNAWYAEALSRGQIANIFRKWGLVPTRYWLYLQ